MKRILFRLDANGNIGFGHFVRCFSLAMMLKDEFQIDFAMGHFNTWVESLLTNNKIKLIPLENVLLQRTDQDDFSELLYDIAPIQNDYELIVLDGYGFGIKYQTTLKNSNVKLAIIEDDGGGKFNADIIINHAIGLKKENYSFVKGSGKLALGPDYVLLRNDFLAQAKIDFNLRRKVQKVFICFGAADPANYTEKIAQSILENTNYIIEALIGAGYSNQTSLKELEEKQAGKLNIHQNLNPTEIIALMHACDIAMVPASGILYECIACRIPTISGYYVPNQKQIYDGIIATNAIFGIGNWQNADYLSVLLNVDSKLAQIQNNQVKLIDGESSNRFIALFKSVWNTPTA